MAEGEREEFGDPLTAPFWAAARRHELVLQRCRACGEHQFYPRPFCLACDADKLDWVRARGTGVVYSTTIIRRQILPDLPVPYVNALVALDEGPRLLTTIVNGEPPIGTRVRVTWRERTDAPPLPVFEPMKETS